MARVQVIQARLIWGESAAASFGAAFLNGRAGASEHGHIHLFARRKLWARRLRSAREIEFAKLTGEPAETESTRHLLTIGFDAEGIPTSLFTVNSWVTGDG